MGSRRSGKDIWRGDHMAEPGNGEKDSELRQLALLCSRDLFVWQLRNTSTPTVSDGCDDTVTA